LAENYERSFDSAKNPQGFIEKGKENPEEG
jgi:hypothetical protein